MIVVGVLIALQAVGIDLTLLSVFGGALGVGIGLGLQKLASNYIAGFTILLDRSIRLGDMVTVDDRFGLVSEVDVALRRRAQPRRRRGDRAERDAGHDDGAEPLVHVPRSPDGDPGAGGHDGDVAKALRLMEAGRPRRAARADRSPNAPMAFLVQFAERGIDLELGVWIADPENGQLALRSVLNQGILPSFRANGIDIPFPQRELRVVGRRIGSPRVPGTGTRRTRRLTCRGGAGGRRQHHDF